MRYAIYVAGLFGRSASFARETDAVAVCRLIPIPSYVVDSPHEDCF